MGRSVLETPKMGKKLPEASGNNRGFQPLTQDFESQKTEIHPYKAMKNTLFITLLASFFIIHPTHSIARVGETVAEIEVRYGKPIESGTVTSGAEGKRYHFEGMEIVVFFADGTSGMEIYLKTSGEFSENEAQIILKANGGAKAWDPYHEAGTHEAWWLEDGSLMAIFHSKSMGEPSEISVMSKAFMGRENQKTKDTETKNLEGL